MPDPEPTLALSKELAEFLQRHGLKPAQEPDDRGTAIHLAVRKANASFVAELLRVYRGDCVNAVDKRRIRGRTPLHSAASLGLNDIVAKLLEQGADVNARTRRRWTALMLASEAGNAETVRMLLKHEADMDAQSDPAGDRGSVSALHLAAERSSPATLLQLLWHGADVGIANSQGDTPLHFAVGALSGAAFLFLLFHGAVSAVVNKQGVSPLRLVQELPARHHGIFEHHMGCFVAGAKEQFLACVNHDVNSPDLPRAIHRAVERDMKGALVYFLHMDRYLKEVKSPGGWYRPLHVAARLGRTEQARTLVRHGAEVDCKTKRDWTPLMLAAEHGHGEIVQLLLQNGASVLLKNKDGNTAALLARRSGLAIPGLLLPAFRHVPISQVPRSGDSKPENVNKSGSNMLPVPKRGKDSREPSPGWSAEPEGELFSVTDATFGDSSRIAPQNSDYVEKLLSSLERTWYERVQWCPEDDIGKSRESDWSGPVKIAILDTGIDLDHEDFQRPARRRSKIGKAAVRRLPEQPQRERIKAWKNFVGKPGEEADVTDTIGHGTHIAGIVLAIAPRAELYVAKVSSGEDQSRAKKNADDSGESPRRTSGRPVQEWAIDQGVDIINLSLGFPHESSYELTKTLEEANYKDIIVLAAAANHGNREAISWPARDRDLSLCVTSGDEYNNLSRFAPGASKDLPVFITHGEHVSSQWPTNLGGGFRSMSGTSVSTPIAAGMTAMILAFLNTTSAWSPEQKRQWLDRSTERRLRGTRGMGRLLAHICRDRSGLKVLSPKLLWEENPEAGPLKALSLVSQAFTLPG
ncbi:hypothetical protein UVI_02014640 [Ustilaginoidea virens]|uniref:Peptidase S8/S53 domain-containing protein n=1 Tax=Ustilaginoidea virens TaxID=1159556 RepID=A0A1B5L7E5_USTVR|nr:hypothetical protein UVI_02014640 [Ustilaginoidea virens]